MKLIKKLTLIFIPMIVILLSWQINFFFNPIPVYKYKSTDGTFKFVCYPSKGRSIEFMEKAKKRYEETNNINLILCRDFDMKLLKFWEWKKYLFSPYYKNYEACD